CWPISGAKAEPAETEAISDCEPIGCLGKLGFQVLAVALNENARASLLFGFSLPCANMSIICLIGVMPQMASLANGKLYAIAPTSLLSMKTGEPDIPANTPVLSTSGPFSFAIMVDCRGPVNPSSTPKTSRLNSCGSVPEKTVRATPFIPGRRSSIAKSGMLDDDSALAVRFVCA